MHTQSIDQGQFVEINGVEQWLALRGKDLGNPAMLVISGPGVALSSIAPFFENWEQEFTLIHWDQPGAGATYGNSDQGKGPLSLDRLVSDGLEVVESVRRLLNVQKVMVLGISAGSIVGLKMMQQKPALFSAYVGTGQFVNWAEQDALSYKLLLEKACTENNEEAQKELRQIGPPPYADSAVDGIKSKYHSALTAGEMAAMPVFSALMVEVLSNPRKEANHIPRNVKLEHPRELATLAYDALRPELMSFDAGSMSAEYAMPMFFFQGDQDFYSVTSLVQAYETEITAPVKQTIVIEGGSHSVIWLREQFLELLKRHVRPVAMTP